MGKRNKIVYTEEQIKNAVKNSFSWRQVLIKLGFSSNAGGNYKTIQNKAKNLKIDTSHFKGMGWNLKGTARNAIRNMFVKGIFRNSENVKQRLLKEHLVKNECSICRNEGIWLEQNLVLELDHINGDRSDNTVDNLRLLCPNCHSQTISFRGRNKKWEHMGCACEKCGIKIWYKNKSGICKKCQVLSSAPI